MGAVSKYDLKVDDLIEFKRTNWKSTLSFIEHWAVYVGNNEIVHYQKPRSGGGKGEIIREDLDDYIYYECSDFVGIKKGGLGLINGILHDPEYSGREVARRALSMVGERGYNLAFKNCEHFAKWCKYDTAISEQVENKVEKTLLLGGTGAGAGIGGAIGIVGGPPGVAVGAVVGGAIGAAGGLTAAALHWTYTSLGRLLKKGDQL